MREHGEDILLLSRTLLQSYAKEESKRFKDFDIEAARVLLEISTSTIYRKKHGWEESNRA